MDRAWKSGASGSQPVHTENTAGNYPTGGNPGTGTPATKPGAFWFHMITEEIRKVITDAGLTPDKSNLAQLSAAVSALALAGVGGGDVVLFGDYGIRRNTVDGSDNGHTTLNGGGANGSQTRGGYFRAYGNEAADPGSVVGFCGNVAGARFAVIAGSGATAFSIDGATGIANSPFGMSLANNRFFKGTNTLAAVSNILGVDSSDQTVIGSPDFNNSMILRTGGAAGDIILKPNATEVARWLAAGGLKFPATQLASTDANALDDYEEGVWTPVIGGAGGTSGQTYTTQTGHYVKIGQLVTAQFVVTLSAKGTITGNVQIQGLPFTALSGLSVSSAEFDWANLATNWFSVFAAGAIGGGTAITVKGNKDSAGAVSAATLTTADLGNTSSLTGTIVYRAAA